MVWRKNKGMRFFFLKISLKDITLILATMLSLTPQFFKGLKFKKIQGTKVRYKHEKVRRRQVQVPVKKNIKSQICDWNNIKQAIGAYML